MAYLKEAKLGRATFLPVSAVKVRNLSVNDRQYLNTNGCLGVASELVKCEAYYKPVVESLLGATVVCDTLDNAVTLAKRSGYAFRIVTLEGDLLSPQGSMSGGSKKNNDSMLLGKDNEIKQLTAHIEEQTRKLHEEESKLAEYNAALNKINTKIDLGKIELQDISNNYYASSTKLEGLNNTNKELEEDIFSTRSQILVANKYVEELNKDIDSTDQLEMNFDVSNKQAVSLENTAYEELKKKR
ncbi:MAG: hypothetical protein MJ149_03105, partial [Clostridia bacterium]|nr:hypothetical protein [Clostridia bacterium]